MHQNYLPFPGVGQRSVTHSVRRGVVRRRMRRKRRQTSSPYPGPIFAHPDTAPRTLRILRIPPVIRPNWCARPVHVRPWALLEEHIRYTLGDSIGRSAIGCVEPLAHGARLHRKIREQCGGRSMT